MQHAGETIAIGDDTPQQESQLSYAIGRCRRDSRGAAAGRRRADRIGREAGAVSPGHPGALQRRGGWGAFLKLTGSLAESQPVLHTRQQR